METVHELVRSATDPDPVSVSPGSLSRGEGKKPRAISLVHQYHAEHKARLARMGGPCQITHPGELESALRLIEAPELPVSESPEPIPCYPVIPFLPPPPPAFPAHPSLQRIVWVVAGHFEVPLLAIKSSRRDRQALLPRQIIMYLCRTMTPMSFPQIGRKLGNRDHTTVIHSFQKIRDRMKISEDLRDLIAKLEVAITQ
jgi:hypothetical protein